MAGGWAAAQLDVPDAGPTPCVRVTPRIAGFRVELYHSEARARHKRTSTPPGVQKTEAPACPLAAASGFFQRP